MTIIAYAIKIYSRISIESTLLSFRSCLIVVHSIRYIFVFPRTDISLFQWFKHDT